jgi:hypothetical protein
MTPNEMENQVNECAAPVGRLTREPDSLVSSHFRYYRNAFSIAQGSVSHFRRASAKDWIGSVNK